MSPLDPRRARQNRGRAKECRLSYRLGALAKQFPEHEFAIEGIRRQLANTQESLGNERDIRSTVVWHQGTQLWRQIKGEPYSDE